MKILIAYDGSESADKGIDDLRRAGLPDGSRCAGCLGRGSVASSAGG